jgi:hypothetical protein
MRPVLPLAALALGCAGAPPPRPLPASAPAATLDGRSLHPEGLHELVRARYWDAVQAQRDTPAPTGEGLTRNALAAWLRGRVEALRSLHPLIAQLNQRSPDDALFASVLYGRLVDTLSAEVAALPRVAGVSADLEDIWRRALTGAVAPLTRSALDAWRRCATVAPRASLELRAWEPVCTAQAEVLAARLEASPAPAAPPRRPAALAMPTECDGPELRASHVDPEAPPPDLGRPPALALRVVSARLSPADAARLREAVWQTLQPRVRMARVPPSEVAAAEALQRARRWRSDGPVCGQAPPLPALLAARHPNLVLGTVEAWCGTVHAEDGSARERCSLSVSYRRAGSDSEEGLPQYRSVDVSPDGDAVAPWLAAARSLGDDRPSSAMSNLLGGLGAGPPVLFRAVGYAAYDPWLRVGPTLYDDRDEGARTALTACVTRPGTVGSYAVAWTISAAGVAESVTVRPETAPADGSGEAVAACVRDVIARTGWPCPRGGAPVPVSARVCLGRQPAEAPAVATP